MQIADRYKRTEVGVIPDDWDVGSVKTYAAITTGNKNTQDRVDDGRFPFFVRSQTVERINSFSFDGEAVLTAGDGVGTGKVFHYINGPFDFHQRVYNISDFAPELNGYYFFLYFGEHFYERIMQMTAKSSVDSVRMEMIADMLLPVPPLAEQRAIAEALSDVDALINALDALVTKKRHIKQGTMQQLLTGKKRLPGFSGEWEETTLGELGTFFSGGTPSTSVDSYYDGGTVPWITSSDCNSGRIRFVAGRITESGLDNSAAKMIAKGSLLVALYGATAGVVAVSEIEAAINQAVLAGELRDADSSFVFHKLTMLKDWIITTYTQGGQPNLSGSIVKSIVLSLPDLDEQQVIATVLDDMDAEITALEQKRDKTKLIKQGMMQELLTGKTRLVARDQP